LPDSTTPILPAAAVAAMVERAEKATPGPWIVSCDANNSDDSGDGGALRSAGEVVRTVVEGGQDDFGAFPVGFIRNEDADFTAHARADLPSLAASHEALRAEVERLREAVLYAERECHKWERHHSARGDLDKGAYWDGLACRFADAARKGADDARTIDRAKEAHGA